jgi:ribosomal-protein-alanine N-acetyltransferase
MPAAAFPQLSTDRLELRAVTFDDAAAFHAILSVPEVTRFSNWPDQPAAEEAVRFVRNMSSLFASGDGCAWIIEARESREMLGAIRFNYFNYDWKLAGVGYELHPSAWGSGVMTEALRAVVACGHGTFGMNRLEAWTLPGNGASDRVLEKAGFRFEGTLRQRAHFKGAFHDFRFFGRVATDPRS